MFAFLGKAHSKALWRAHKGTRCNGGRKGRRSPGKTRQPGSRGPRR